MRVTCGECRFWKARMGTVGAGECRRRPPLMREGEPWGEWLQTSKEDWCGEGARQGEVEDRPVVVEGVEVDVAQLGRPVTEGLIINRKGWEQLRGDLIMERNRRIQLDDEVQRMAKRISELEEACKMKDASLANLRKGVEKEKPAVRTRKPK